MTAPSAHIAALRAALSVPQDTERFNAAHNFLRSRLIATRDTAIGRDFVFAADPDGVDGALKDLIEIEHQHGKDLSFDYAEVGGYFLLRIAGLEGERADINAYFD